MPHTKTARDTLLRLTLMGGEARVLLCDTTNMTQQARDIHHASIACTSTPPLAQTSCPTSVPSAHSEGVCSEAV